jgi:hypothetical protein
MNLSKSWKTAHLGEDNSGKKPGFPTWGFSIGLVTRFYKDIPRFLRRKVGLTSILF